MKPGIQIGNTRAVRGERVYGDVEVTRRVDGTPISIPVILVQGEEPGPVGITSAPCSWSVRSHSP